MDLNIAGGLNPNIIRNISKTLLVSLYSCQTEPARHKVRLFVERLRSISLNDGGKFQEGFCSVLLERYKNKDNSVVTISSSKPALEVLQWLIIVGKENPNSPSFIELLAYVTSHIQSRRLERMVEIKLRVFCNSLSHEILCGLLTGLTKDEKYLIALSYVLRFCKRSDKLDKILVDRGQIKNEIIELFIRGCILTKVKKSAWVLNKICSNLVQILITVEDFKETILPAVQKAMLRSPETAIEAVGCTLKSVSIDLSPYSLQLGKMLTASLHSQNDSTRTEAVFASKSLALKVADPDALKLTIDYYFAVFHGAEGKITVASHKITILNAVKEMSKCEVTNPDVASWIVEKVIQILESEVHEGIQMECLDIISCWSQKLGSQLPPALLQYLSKGLTHTKSPVKTSLCNVIVSIFTEKRVDLLDSVLDVLCKALEKSASQSAQVHCLSESIALSSVVLLSSSELKKIPDHIMSTSVSLLSHANEKFFNACLPWSAIHVSLLVEQIVSGHTSKGSATVSTALVHDTDVVYTALALALTYKDYQVRNIVKETIQRMLSHPSGAHSCMQIIYGLERVSAITPSNIYQEVLMFVASETFKCIKSTEHESIAVTFLCAAHHCIQNNVWIRLIRRMGLVPETVVISQWQPALQTHLEEFDCTQTKREIAKTLSKLNGDLVVGFCVDHFLKLMSDPAILSTSRDDYFIFRTPSDQLYDTSVMETGEGEMGKNMKRESKVYSYKEQLEEIQLKKELEENRKKSGKAVQLTPKQKDAIKIQMEKEASIRANVKELDSKVNNAIGLLESALEGNRETVGFFVKDFIHVLIDVMQSPVAAPHAIRLFEKLGICIFSFDRFTGYAVSQISLRLVSPKCDLQKDWQSEPLSKTLQRMMRTIEVMSQENSGFTSACYSYCFPMLRLAVHDYFRDSSVVASVLNTTLAISKRRSLNLQHNPEFIPRTEIAKLLYYVIGISENRNQQLAVSALIELAKSGSGNEEITTVAESDELRTHVEALMSHLKVTREAGLRCLAICSNSCSSCDSSLTATLISNIYREQFDPDAELAEFGKKLWIETGFDAEFSICDDLLKGIIHSCEAVRGSSAKAMRLLAQSYPMNVHSLVLILISTYESHLILTPPVLDSFGRVLEDGFDKWEGRCGVGLAFRELNQIFPISLAESTMKWIVTKTLSDRSQNVHCIMLEAAVDIVQNHGKECLSEFVTVIESFLDNAGDSGQFDNVRQACVVLMGCLARHLDPSDPRVKSIFGTLIDTLSTPSEKVQQAVANCLPALVPAINAEATAVLDRLTNKLMNADNYGERRGAAFGLAGMIKGLGILSLKQHNIMNVLATGMQDKKNYRHREGALMALELLCEFLGRLFEPYIVHVLPYLLQCLGDSNQYVREATENTSRCVMSRLSGHGVKLVLPSLLAALNEDSWRTKCGSVDLLGRMAYCAPRQLSGCLPMIVPRLIEVLGDSHVKVQDSAAKALSLIGSVIRNPEIQSVVLVLLEALQDPGKKTSLCLQALLRTEFVHFVDPPSLALIMPVVQRAFQDRSTENRKMAAQIIGNMYSLTDHSDLAPYMENVMPGLKSSLLDPVPEVRAVAAKALGAMAKGMGEKCYDELLPWLMKTLISEVNSVDRSGAAQGLSEVIGSLGEDKLHKFMPEVIRKADSDNLAPHVRDGYMMMFIYMPSVFEQIFVPYIGQIINPILKALADENEFVRETALRAGQRIVTGYAETAITLLLPELEKGIFDDNWRIRFSSVQLLGDLLYKISGVSGKMSTESANDDDNFGTEQSQKIIIEALGLERRNRVLAGLYMGRSDVALMVRQAALHVWKVVVANTPKTLREILPTLFSLLLGCLASHSHDKRQVAARTLGDLVRKLGEKILPEIIPILEKGLESPRSDERQGVCIGLSEIMASTSRDMVMAFVENLVPTLRKALCDPSSEVREAAALTFGSLHATVGSRALDEILPFMMKKLNDEKEGEFALDGLGHVLKVKSKAVMPYLIPQLTAYPPNIKALAILASVAGDSLSRHLTKILPALITVLSESAGGPEEAQQLRHCEEIVLAVIDDQGVRLLVDELLVLKKSDKIEVKRAAVALLSIFSVHTKADLTPYVGQLLRGLILLMGDTDEIVLQLSADALTAVVKALGSSERLTFVADVRQAIRFAQSDLKGRTLLPGLCLSKGINPVLPIFREALLNGSADLKEQAALGMGELILLSNAEALKPSVIHITGPLIRILGDRYGPNIKGAVLDTLTLLLCKVGFHLKAFLPQLQTTFLKAANDPNRNVRLKAAAALSQLVPIHNKPDPLFQELITTAKQTEDSSIRDTMIFTLRSTIVLAGDKMIDTTRKTVTSALFLMLQSVDEPIRVSAAGCLGALLKWIPQAETETIMFMLTSEDEVEATVRHARTTALVVGLKEACNRIYVDKKERINKIILNMLISDRVQIVSNGIRACGHIFMYCIQMDVPLPSNLLIPFAKALNNPCNEVKGLLGQISEVIGRKTYPKILSKELYKYLIPSLVNGTKEKNSMVRASCESALVSILHLRQGDSTMAVCLEALDHGAKEALSDVVTKVLRKVLNFPEGKEPDIDDTILN